MLPFDEKRDLMSRCPRAKHVQDPLFASVSTFDYFDIINANSDFYVHYF